MIEVKNIHKSFNENHVLKGLSTSFEAGKTNMIIGGSGSGKTVFIKCMLGLHPIDEGEILYDEREFAKLNFDEKRDIRKEMGMVFQGGALFDSLTIEQNIMLPIDMFTKQTIEEKLERINFVLKRVNLENVNHLFPAEISGGMQKRVSIARAIAMHPKYLFCDEPNSGLDPKTAIVIDNLIQEITQEYNIVTVINTHDMNSVIEIGDKISFIHEGLIVWEGDKHSILKSDNNLLNDFVYCSDLLKRIKQ